MEAFQFNRRVVLERLAGDEDILAVMVDMFLEDLDNYCEAVAKALAAGDAGLTQREAHTIKGLLSSFEDLDGTALAYQIEQAAKRGELSDLSASVNALQRRLREVAGVLQAG